MIETLTLENWIDNYLINSEIVYSIEDNNHYEIYFLNKNGIPFFEIKKYGSIEFGVDTTIEHEYLNKFLKINTKKEFTINEGKTISFSKKLIESYNRVYGNTIGLKLKYSNSAYYGMHRQLPEWVRLQNISIIKSEKDKSVILEEIKKSIEPKIIKPNGEIPKEPKEWLTKDFGNLNIVKIPLNLSPTQCKKKGIDIKTFRRFYYLDTNKTPIFHVRDTQLCVDEYRIINFMINQWKLSPEKLEKIIREWFEETYGITITDRQYGINFVDYIGDKWMENDYKMYSKLKVK
jgi:hypothetical protein